LRPQNRFAVPSTPVSLPEFPQDTGQQQLIRAVRSGFAVVLTLTVILGGIGLYQLYSVNTSMSKIVTVNNTKIALASAMRDAIRLRALSINKMLATTDYFKRDSELMRFYEYARTYRDARDQLLALGLDGREQAIIEKLTRQANVTQPKARQVAEMLMENALPPDFNQRFIDTTRQQEALFELLDQSIDLQKEYANHAVSAARIKFEYTVVSLLAMLAVLLSIGVVIARIVVRYVSDKNRMLALKNAELHAARAKADEATRAKSEFLANMSHEIRTPLTTILGFSESLVEEEPSEDERRRAVLAISNSGKHLYDIINDILDISKIEAGKLEVETVAVSPLDVVKDAVCIIENKAAERDLQLHIEYDLPIPQTIVTDPIRLKQILLNLCGNAVKFTEAGSITVRLGYNANTNQMLFSVRDTGIGMTPEQVDRVFFLFQQAEKSTSRFYGGTGLGLSISKQLAQRLGGDIECRSEVGKGTTFIVSVSAGEREPAQWINEQFTWADNLRAASHVSGIPQLTGNVLLAEDSTDIQALILMYLKKAGVAAVGVANGAEAVQEALSGHFDLVLMDVQMPVMDGLSAIRQMREQGLNTPIVALTANATREDERLCLSCGADGFLAKPVDVNVFYNMLEQYLSPDKALPAATPGDGRGVAPVIEDSGFDSQMQQLIRSFVSGLPATVKEITSYFRQEQWQELLSTSHRLKGAGGAFGYPELSEISRNIMEKVKQKNHQELQELIERLNQHCRQITRKAG